VQTLDLPGACLRIRFYPRLSPDVETSLPDRLQQVDLPAPLSPGPELLAAVQAVLRLLDVAPDRVMIPLLAALHRSIIGSLLPVLYSIFLAGPTGAMKSTLADLIQCFWGLAFLLQRPENWTSTANRIEKMTFEAKDMVLLIDDFKPGITARSFTMSLSSTSRTGAATPSSRSGTFLPGPGPIGLRSSPPAQTHLGAAPATRVRRRRIPV